MCSYSRCPHRSYFFGTTFRVPETLSEDILKIVKAPPKPDYPIATIDTLAEYEGFIFGAPTRYGSMPAQLKVRLAISWFPFIALICNIKSFLDGTGGLWAKGTLAGKYASVMYSTGTGSGGEMTALSFLTTFVHHGINFVPLGYHKCFAQLSNISEVKGASAWGAGTLAGPDGSRQPSALELEIAGVHGTVFYNTIARVDFSKPL